MSTDRQWTLGGKLALVAAPFALLALGAIAAPVWMASQLDGGAAAVNEAGRMRMQTYLEGVQLESCDTPLVQ